MRQTLETRLGLWLIAHSCYSNITNGDEEIAGAFSHWVQCDLPKVESIGGSIISLIQSCRGFAIIAHKQPTLIDGHTGQVGYFVGGAVWRSDGIPTR